MSQAKQNNDLPAFLNAELSLDPEQWLEEKSQRTLNYLKQQNQNADQWLDPALQETLFQEIRHRTPLDNDSYPSSLEKFSYFVRTQEALNYPQYWRYPVDLNATSNENPNAAPNESSSAQSNNTQPDGAHCYLDINPMAEEEEFFDLGDMAISPDEMLLAITTDTEGDEQFQLQIINLEDGSIEYFDDLPPLTSDLIWSENQHQLICFPLDDTQRPWQIMVLDIFTGEQTIIFTEEDARFWVGCSKSRDRQTLFIESLSKQSSEYYFVPANQPDAPLQLISPREEGHEYHADSIGDKLYIRSNCQHACFSLLAIDKNQTPLDKHALKHAQLIEPASQQQTFEGFELFDHHMLILSRDHTLGQQHLAIKDLDGQLQHQFKAPYPLISINLSDNPLSNTNSVRLELESFNQPPALYSYQMAEQTLTKLKQLPLNNTDLSQFSSQQITVPAWDGSTLPISLVGQTEQLNRARNGKPVNVLLYVYGAYGDALDPWFSSSRLSLMERGVVFAIAHLRGGGDCGEHWYHQGRLGYKENSIRDLQSSVQGLIKRGITDASKLVLQGGSAAGIVLGAVYNRIPELIHGMIAEVPFVDVLRTMSRPELPLTVTEYEEWGNPENTEEHWRIQHYSPLDNLQLHTTEQTVETSSDSTSNVQAHIKTESQNNKPLLWIEAGLNDPRVQYWEPAKWSYRLQQAGIQNHWLRTRMDSGHAGGSGRDQSYREIAESQSVVLKMLGLDQVSQ